MPEGRSISFRIDYIWQLCVSTTSSSYSYDEEDDDGVSLRLLISVWILIVGNPGINVHTMSFLKAGGFNARGNQQWDCIFKISSSSRD